MGDDRNLADIQPGFYSGFHREGAVLLQTTLAQSGEVKLGVQRVGERHPVEYRPGVEILTQDHGHLPEAGDRPDLGVVVTTLPAKVGSFSGRLDAIAHLIPDGPVRASEARKMFLAA